MNTKPFYHAFKVVHNGRARALITDCALALPAGLCADKDKKFLPFKALWDTGATNSVITKKVVDSVGLAPTGVAVTHGVHGSNEVSKYVIDIGLPNRVCIQDITVTEGALLNGYDILIGMDIIMMGDFAISNPDGKTIFSFCIPSHKNPIDLLEKSEKVNPKFKVPPPITA
ncbi:MAG: aspartyl protease family protein [Candidatus Omnitrophica bacterium]|nr:aspartyl protease family protein [Candidatus Omnitrophota bacterium]